MNPSNYPQEHPAYIMAQTGKVVTYGELEESSNRIAQLFRNLGLVRGDNIALCMENHPEFLKVCWGAFRAGLYFTAISYRLQAEEVEYIVNDCGAKVLITSALLRDTFLGFSDKLTNNPTCYMVDGTAQGASSFEDAVSKMPGKPIADQSYGQSLLYSSGTTGRPKGVKKPLIAEVWGDEVAGFIPARDRYQFDEKSIYLSPAPLYHAAPLGFNMNVLRYGGTSIVMENFDAEQSLRLIQEYQITHSQWVPTMFVRMLKLPEDVRLKYNVSSLKFAVHAAAPCPITVKEQMIAWWGPILFEYYAGTEGNGSTAIDSEEWLQHKGSVGRITNNCKLHILDDEGNSVATGKIGNVFFEGGGKFEYLHDEGKTKASHTTEGWSTLGDIGYLDQEGYLYLTDRKSFMIISGGVNIYPQEAENILIAHPKITDVAVFGVPNEEFGEEVKAVVQPADMNDVGPELEAELIAYVRGQISHMKCPKSIDFLEELPRHPTGKLYKRLLKDKYWP
ncbi:MAG: acyl-CoA synthetase [Pseudomonadales bacterium]|jgi:acyl-CoA synthetase (AMP-forming)/AMP-acid ligase II